MLKIVITFCVLYTLKSRCNSCALLKLRRPSDTHYSSSDIFQPKVESWQLALERVFRKMVGILSGQSVLLKELWYDSFSGP